MAGTIDINGRKIGLGKLKVAINNEKVEEP